MIIECDGSRCIDADAARRTAQQIEVPVVDRSEIVDGAVSVIDEAAAISAKDGTGRLIEQTAIDVEANSRDGFGRFRSFANDVSVRYRSGIGERYRSDAIDNDRICNSIRHRRALVEHVLVIG